MGNVKLDILAQSQIENFTEDKFKVQIETLKLLAIQSLFSSSLSTKRSHLYGLQFSLIPSHLLKL